MIYTDWDMYTYIYTYVCISMYNIHIQHGICHNITGFQDLLTRTIYNHIYIYIFMCEAGIIVYPI